MLGKNFTVKLIKMTQNGKLSDIMVITKNGFIWFGVLDSDIS